MKFQEYQDSANATDQMPLQEGDIKALIVPLLGLAGETGSLLTHYKRYLRDGEGYEYFRQRISEELGDILWNVANIATKSSLLLEDIAAGNLAKIRDRWIDQSSLGSGSKSFDHNFPDSERFPREFAIDVRAAVGPLGREQAVLSFGGQPFGDPLGDNSDGNDGYRLHDVFHLAFVAHLGWSPVLRGRNFFNCKRRSSPDVDEIQDGGRAAVIDEAIVAIIFAEARKNGFYEHVETVEYGTLRTIKELTAHLEVSRCTGREWEGAILEAFHVWRALKAHRLGTIAGNLDIRSLRFVPET